MAIATGKYSGWSVPATIAAWLIAASCLALCAAALSLWQADLSIRRRLPEMGYNDILALRDDAWIRFRAPLAWALTIASGGAAATSCLPTLLVRRPVAWTAAAISLVAAAGTLGYLIITR